jgi:GrpB-like predicted nucleotidyltransferase (UPF0157 family)
LAFRDYLRSHPEVADEYAALKTDLAAACGADPNERDAYRFGKADFVRRVTEQGLAVGPERATRPDPGNGGDRG